MVRYVLDTNIFFNLEIKSGLGNNPKEIIEQITKYIHGFKASGKGQFYIPPRIHDEFLTFFEGKEDYVTAFLSAVTIQSPHIHDKMFPAELFYRLIEEIRHRSYRGLQVAEEELGNTAKRMMGKPELDRIEFQKTVGDDVKKLRERYRQATRHKFLDSTADLDLIVLAKELDAYLVSADEGVLLWGRMFGVKEIPPQLLKEQLAGHIE